MNDNGRRAIRTIDEVLWELYGVEGKPREECPLSDTELERLRGMPEFTMNWRCLDFEYDCINKLESANENSRNAP